MAVDRRNTTLYPTRKQHIDSLLMYGNPSRMGGGVIFSDILASNLSTVHGNWGMGLDPQIKVLTADPAAKNWDCAPTEI
jgi:hypothetical protein